MPVINVLKTRNTPFALLSNDYRQKIRIMDKTYPSVTNYIYSNMLNTPLYKNIIRLARPRKICSGNEDCEILKSSNLCKEAGCNFKVKSIGLQYAKLKKDEQNNLRKESLETALNNKLDQNPELANILVNTGTRPIVYVSKGKWMGTGENNDGENNYGKLLEEARYRLINNKIQKTKTKNNEAREELLYNTYLAYTNLVKLIRSGDDLQSYSGLKSATDILEKMKKKGLEIDRIPDKSIVVKEAKRKQYGRSTIQNNYGIINQDIFVAMRKPKTLVTLVKGKYLPIVRQNKLRQIPNIILEMYCGYVLEKADTWKNINEDDRKLWKKLSKSNYEKAIVQQFGLVGAKKVNETAKQIQKLYEKGMLSERLSKKIDTKIKELNIPSIDDVKESETLSHAIRLSVEKEDKGAPDTENVFRNKITGDKILLWSGNPPESQKDTYKLGGLAPLDKSVSIKINNKVYPCITYYVIAKHVEKCCIQKQKNKSMIDSAYEVLLTKPGGTFLDIASLERKTNRLEDDTYINNLHKYVKIALHVKFKNRKNQNILLSTKKDKLIWGDKQDPILGIGKNKNGTNLVGRELMRIRKQIIQERSTGDIGDLGMILSLDTLNNVFSDRYLTSWFNMRIRDMCNVIIIMKDYLFYKYNKNIDLTPDFITKVLDLIYQPCSHIFAAIDKVTVQAPSAFVDIVQQYNNFLQFVELSNRDEILDIMWKRIAIIIYYLLQQVKLNSTHNIGVVLKRAEYLASANKNCIKIIEDSKENCILSAILNLISGIRKFDKKYRTANELQDIDFDTAVAIILNIKNITELQGMMKKIQRIPPPPAPAPKPNSKIKLQEREDYIRSLLTKRGYSDIIADKVLIEIKGSNPTDEQIEMIALDVDTKISKPPTKQKRPRKRPRIRPRIRQPTANVYNPSDEEEELDIDDDDFDFDMEIDAIIAEVNEGPDFDEVKVDEVKVDEVEVDDVKVEEVEVEQEIDNIIPNPNTSDSIYEALKQIDTSIEKDESYIYTISDTITFIKNYKGIPQRIKTNRINFFASLI